MAVAGSMAAKGPNSAVAVRIRALGPLVVEVGGQVVELRRIEARLLLTLIWSPNTWIDHDTLSERVYFDTQPRDTTSWRNHLRRSLGAASAHIETRRGKGSRFSTAVDGLATMLDAVVFEALLRDAETHLRSGQYEGALATFREAETLWRGPTPFVEIADDVERHAGIVALQSKHRQCRQAAIRLAIDAGEFEAVLPQLRSMVEAEPTDQATIAQLMRASAALGNPALASEYYDRLSRLLRERGQLPTGELIDLHGRILRDELREPAPTSDRLGVDLTTFVGRAAELEHARQALVTARLVSLVGPPGVGKSRLAREVAREQSETGAVWMVQLASCPDGSDVAVKHHIASELGLEFRSGVRFADDVVNRLSDPSAILVLDNCEHVIETLIIFLAGLYGRLDSVRVLATSREPLGIPGEAVLRLRPLTTEAADGFGSATAMCLDRVRQAGGEFTNEAELAEVCRRIDGLPLAIELVAPAIAASGTAATLERLQAGATIGAIGSSGPGRDGQDDRHRSLDAAIAWSFERLNDQERQALMAAATFRTDVDPTDVAELTGTGLPEAADALLSLTSKSLLQPSIDPGRFSLFEVVQRFAQLASRRTDRADGYERAHATWISELASAVESPSARVSAEAAQALRWAISAPAEDGVAIVDALRHELYRFDLPAGLSDWLFAIGDRHDRTGLIATELSTTCAFFQGDYANLERRAQQTLRRVEQLGEPHRLARTYVITSFSFALSGQYRSAAEHAASAEKLAYEVSDRWAYAWAASIDAYQLRRSQQFDQARHRAHQSIERFEGVDYPQGKAFPIFTLATSDYRELGDVPRSIELLRVGIQHAVAGDDPMFEAVGQLYLAQVFAEQGDVANAAITLRRTFACLLTSPQWNLIISGLEYSAVLLASQGDEDTARHLVSVAAHARWKNQVKTRSRAIDHLPASVAEPLLSLPQRPDPKFMTADPLAATLNRAIASLEVMSA